MAAEGKIVLTTKDDTKSGISSATKNLEGLKQSVGEIGKAIVGAFAFEKVLSGLEELGKGAIECVKDFGTMQRSMIQLKAALGGNEEAFKKMNGLIEEMAFKTLEPKDAIEKLVAEMASLGMSTDKIDQVTKATVALSNVTGKDLASAFQIINATYSGSAGKLDKLIPEIGNFTKAQLEAGAAVDLINKKLTGTSDAMSGGVAQQFSNVSKQLDELKEKIGKPFAEVASRVLTAVKPIIEQIGKWLDENSNRIANFFINLPQIAAISFQAVQASLNYIISFDNLIHRFSAASKFMGSEFLVFLKGIGALIAAVGKSIWAPFKVGFEGIIYGLAQTFQGFVNSMIEIQNKIDPKHKWDKIDLGISAPENGNDLLKAAWSTFTSQLKDLGSDWKDATGDLISSLPKELADKIAPLIGEIKVLLNKPGAGSNTDIKVPVLSPSVAEYDMPGYTGTGMGNVTLGAAYTGSGSGVSSVTNTTPYGDAVNGFLSNLSGMFQGSSLTDLFSSLTTAIGPLISAIQPLITTFFSADPLLALLIPIITGFVNALAPAVTTVINPLMNALSNVGGLVAKLLLPILDSLAPVFGILSEILMSAVIPLLNLLAPVIQLVAGILDVVLTPILKAVSVAFEVIMSPIKWLGDLFSWVGNVIKAFAYNITHPFATKQDAGAFSSDAFSGLGDRIAAIWNTDYKTNTAGGTVVGTSTASTGASASYSGGNNTYILNINAPVYGDGGEKVLFADFVSFLQTNQYYNHATA